MRLEDTLGWGCSGVRSYGTKLEPASRQGWNDSLGRTRKVLSSSENVTGALREQAGALAALRSEGPPHLQHSMMASLSSELQD